MRVKVYVTAIADVTVFGGSRYFNLDIHYNLINAYFTKYELKQCKEIFRSVLTVKDVIGPLKRAL